MLSRQEVKDFYSKISRIFLFNNIGMVNSNNALSSVFDEDRLDFSINTDPAQFPEIGNDVTGRYPADYEKEAFVSEVDHLSIESCDPEV